jgi:hypothetical protein
VYVNSTSPNSRSSRRPSAPLRLSSIAPTAEADEQRSGRAERHPAVHGRPDARTHADDHEHEEDRVVHEEVDHHAGECSAEERAKFMTRIGEALGARMDEIATIVSKEVGMAKWLSRSCRSACPSTASTRPPASSPRLPVGGAGRQLARRA